ncbi:zinc ABC transporter substrate-binding protein [Clostridium sp. Sa3CUN1]|uniref:Zinc ABC transporter substrate-binding protein n=1 Tax=Clostridium gallinarum TaxID=2762246 RepID=A0ABR8Q2S8_9CLOT|nr:zinc ABC transporter substrate-binding protein [Clostridium gallinarum]MBD7914733.1 zinc ABC transporter substrate-binding protein [Clostridium gallinarum]
MKRKLISLGLILGILFSFAGCKSNEDLDDDNGERLRVGVTINPLKDFAEAIGGDKVDVFSIIPDGSDAHDFDPKPRDLNDLVKSDIFIYNGLGMEEWIDSVLTTVEGKDVKIVEASTGVDEINLSEEDAHEHATEEEHNENHDEDHDHDHDHDHNGKDPHTWLSLSNAIIEAENIKNAFCEVDPENKGYYEQNFEKLKSEFNSLYEEYVPKFNELSNKDFVTGHAAFGYLCRDFGLTQNSIADVFGEGELTPKNLEALINYCKENGVKTIFSESTSSEKEAETLAKEVSAKVVKVYSLETKEDNMSYLEGMRYNLETIYNELSK